MKSIYRENLSQGIANIEELKILHLIEIHEILEWFIIELHVISNYHMASFYQDNSKIMNNSNVYLQKRLPAVAQPRTHLTFLLPQQHLQNSSNNSIMHSTK